MGRNSKQNNNKNQPQGNPFAHNKHKPVHK
jgi:hypothetical protein